MYWRSRIMPGVICAMVQRRGNAEAPPHHALGSQIARCCGPNLLLTEHPDKKRKSRPRAPHTKSLTCTHANRSATIKAALAILFEAAPNQIRDAARWLVVPSWRTLTALCHLTQSGTHAALSCITSTTIDAFHFLSNVIYSAISTRTAEAGRL
jgi:hypothetical protein